MTVRIATWNINSVRHRAALVERFLREEAPDVLCLQETKTPLEHFPYDGFRALGYEHVVARGEKGYNGVAILSRLPLAEVAHRDFCTRGDARHVAARLPSGTVVHNLYVPAGGDVPDAAKNPKFAHKLDFLAELRTWFADEPPAGAILVGDLNIAPREDDVWNHKRLLRIVSHTPVEVEAMAAMQGAGGWVDVTRAHIPEGQLYSWWSTGRRTGGPRTRGGGSTTSGRRPTSRRARAAAASSATSAAGRARATTFPFSPSSRPER
jgi:exodeoxyribonuclease-3